MSEAFVDWALMGSVGMIFWLLGYLDRRALYPVPIPRWLVLLTGKVRSQEVSLYSLTIQVTGLLCFVWTTILALAIPSHEQRVFLFTLGLCALYVLAGLFVAYRRLLSRH
jgi:hypothetical protein